MNLRRSQTSILYIKFPVFLRWRAMHENACKSLHEGTEICCSFSWDVNLQHQSPLGVFLRDKTIFDFFLTEGRGATFVTPIRVHRKCHISMYFLRKAASHFLPKEKICFREKIPSFQVIQERSCAGVALFGKTIFSERLEKENMVFRAVMWKILILWY